MAFRSDDDKKAYWRRNLNLMFSLLAIWALVSYGFGIVLRPLMDMIPVGGVGLGFWFAQQGSIYVFLEYYVHVIGRAACCDFVVATRT